jgi:hypothetical protein
MLYQLSYAPIGHNAPQPALHGTKCDSSVFPVIPSLVILGASKHEEDDKGDHPTY